MPSNTNDIGNAAAIDAVSETKNIAQPRRNAQGVRCHIGMGVEELEMTPQKGMLIFPILVEATH